MRPGVKYKNVFFFFLRDMLIFFTFVSIVMIIIKIVLVKIYITIWVNIDLILLG